MKPGHCLAIALTQPYPFLIQEGFKDKESRMFATKHRGPILITSTKAKPNLHYTSVSILKETERWDDYLKVSKFDAFTHSIIECVANLTDCREMTFADQPGTCYRYEFGRYIWQLEDVHKPDPVNHYHMPLVQNRQGFFYIPEDIVLNSLGVKLFNKFYR